MNRKYVIGVGILLGVLLVGVLLQTFVFGSDSEETADVAPTPVPEPVNVIAVSERPYVTLQPLTGRNELEFVVHDLKIDADEVEVTLEYDRNEGVQDAILRTFFITELPLEENLFMGSKSAGGHITYHDDVIGGDLTLEFDGDEPYALENKWRYDDKETEYEQLSTADGKFQVQLAEAWRTGKIVVMESPGYPGDPDGEIVAGPYLFRGAGALPDGEAEVRIRLAESVESVQMKGWDGEEWVDIEASVEGKEVSAETEVYEVYIVVKG